MKLKEKLAREFNDSRLEKFVSVESNHNAYIAGFEKALELSAKQIAHDIFYLESDIRTIGCEEVEPYSSPSEPNLVVTAIDRGKGTITVESDQYHGSLKFLAHEFLNLGEEEADGSV